MEQSLQSVIPARSGILSLVKKKTKVARLNSNNQEMVKLAKILHREILLQRR
jgi:hypothetical protein